MKNINNFNYLFNNYLFNDDLFNDDLFNEIEGYAIYDFITWFIY